MAKTIIYLPTDQLEGLKARARAQRISATELVRRLVRDYLGGASGVTAPAAEVYSRIVGLGASGRPDGGDDHDRHIADALSRDHLR
jgi:Ribbon-helix-helix protein, copG family